MVGGPSGGYTGVMWRRWLTLGGFVIGAALAACLVNCPAEQATLGARLAVYSGTPLLVLLSPILFLLSSVGLYAGHVAGLAGSAVVTWTMLGFASGLVADRRR